MPKMTLRKRHKPTEVLHLVRREDKGRLLENRLRKYHAFDLQEALLLMDESERQRFYAHVENGKLARVFEQLPEERGAAFIMELAESRAKEVISLMAPDDAIDLLQNMKDKESADFMELLDKPKQERLRKLWKYRHSTAGAEMNPAFIHLHPDMDVKEAMKRLVAEADKVETIDSLFVVDEGERLLGLIDLKTLIVAKHPLAIKEIMNPHYRSVHTEDGIQKVVRDIQKYDTDAMPVLDDDERIQGVITMYDALDIIEEAAHDDYAKLAAVSPEDSPREKTVKSAQSRFPWLALLLVLNLIIASVLASFEETISRVTALVLFQPLILGMAGNIGTQSLAVTVLSISRETLTTRLSATRHLLREAAIGLVNGLLLGMLTFLLAFAFLTVAPMGVIRDGLIEPVNVALVVGLAVFTALTVSAFQASLIPMVLHKVGIDPAVASGPFITTINDITALVVYFGLATAMVLTLL